MKKNRYQVGIYLGTFSKKLVEFCNESQISGRAIKRKQTDKVALFKTQKLWEQPSLTHKTLWSSKSKYWRISRNSCKTNLARHQENGTLPFTKIGGILYYDHREIMEVLERNKVNPRFWVFWRTSITSRTWTGPLDNSPKTAVWTLAMSVSTWPCSIFGMPVISGRNFISIGPRWCSYPRLVPLRPTIAVSNNCTIGGISIISPRIIHSREARSSCSILGQVPNKWRTSTLVIIEQVVNNP